MNRKFAAAALMSFALAGCATSMTMTGKAYASVSPDSVKVLFKDKPDCNYEELGFISTPMEWNQNVAVGKARKEAAKVGADYIVIQTVNKNGFNDASVGAVAYKCGKVDRDKVDVHAR